MTIPLRSARTSPAISPVERPFWETVLPMGRRMPWRPHELVLGGGMHTSGLHVIVTGLFQTVAYSRTGLKRTLWEMRPWNIFGEVTLLVDMHPIYQMECVEAGETVFFDRALITDTILPSSPEIALSMMRILALKLRNQSEDSQEWNFLPVVSRVARMLFHIREQRGDVISITHQELADFLGIHRVSVTNALKELSMQGAIECGRGGIRITDTDRLSAVPGTDL